MSAEADSAQSATANELPFEQRSAIWTLYYASQSHRRGVIERRATNPGAPGSNAESPFTLPVLGATNARAMTTHRLTKVALRRGLDDLVAASLARHSIGHRRANMWALTSRGRGLVGEPR